MDVLHPSKTALLRRLTSWTMLSAVLVVACTPVEPALEPPVITSFTADPSVVGVGISVTLAWELTGATKLTLQPGNVDVTEMTSVTVSPTATTTYTLIATNRAGQANRQVEVRVGSPPVIGSFAANPPATTAGSSATLSWTVAGATSLTLQPGGVDVLGSTSTVVSPDVTTTFTLVAGNDFGDTQRQLEIRIGEAPDITSFTAEPAVATAGEAVTLSWETAGATSLTLQPGGLDVTTTTSTTVYPTTTTTYTLAASNPFGDAQRQVEARVGTPPTITSFGPTAGPVNPGLAVTLQWAVADSDTLWLFGPELGGGVDVTGASSYQVPAVPPGASYTLLATNAIAEVEAETTASRTVPAVSLLIAGQSNAVGKNVPAAQAGSFITAAEGVGMLGNDYAWKPAYEPTDDCTGQIDLVSYDYCLEGVSFGVSAGNGTQAATGGSVFLIPAAKSASRASSWAPTVDPYDRDTLFGSAAHRSRLAAIERGAPLGHQWEGASYGAVLWYQGESETSTLSRTNSFRSLTDVVFDSFQFVLGAPIIFVQLSRRGPTGDPDDPDATLRNLLYQRVRETQRRMETGARELSGAASSAAEPGRFLVVTHDLPLHPGQGRHLSAEAQLELGRRIALAIRQHLLGEDIDGSGPRLVSVEFPTSTQVRVRMDRPITAPTTTDALAYAGYFGVFSGGEALAVSSIVRHPSDSASVLITLQQTAPGPVEVRYMPPPGIPSAVEPGVIRSASCSEPMPGTSLCLPLPAFGIAADGVELSSIQVFSAIELE